MTKKNDSIVLFDEKQIRRHWDADKELWYFSVVDVIAVLTESKNPQAYWRKLKERLKKEGNETVTNCHALKMKAEDGKMRMTNVANTKQMLRLVQSIPSPKVEPLKLWLAKVGYERIEEMEDPELAELSTTEISKAKQPTTFSESKHIAKEGGDTAKKARKDIEQKSVKKIISSTNMKQLGS